MSKNNGDNFLAYRVKKAESGNYEGSVQKRLISELPGGDVLIKVSYSGLNYKDALSAFGRPVVTRNYPHTPGIDASGVVVEDRSGKFSSGDKVIVTSYDLGMNTEGGFGQYIRVPSEWVIPLPGAYSLRDSMLAGTPGLTAAQGVMALIEAGQTPENGPVVVTGARGAVGSYAVALLAKLGFEVIAAVSSLGDDTEAILSTGASSVIDSDITDDKSGRALLRAQWAGGYDTIGDNTLATILKSCSYGGNVVCVGNIQSGNLNTTVFPFIIRGIKLIGVATQDTPMDLRLKLWNLLSSDWKVDLPDEFTREIGLDDLRIYLQKMIDKKSRGRVLLNLWS